MTELRQLFTERVIRFESTNSHWYELCPQDRESFNQMIEPLFASHATQNKPNVIAAINNVIKRDALNVEPLSKYSSLCYWLDTYWALYINGKVIIAYKKHGRAGIKIFTVPETEKKYLM